MPSCEAMLYRTQTGILDSRRTCAVSSSSNAFPRSQALFRKEFCGRCVSVTISSTDRVGYGMLRTSDAVAWAQAPLTLSVGKVMGPATLATLLITK